jgi:probable addiction module antidote protein
MRYAFTTALDIAFTFTVEARRSSFFFVAVTKAHKRRTSGKQSSWQKSGVNSMSEKITAYDPAEDLISDKGIAYFMNEAFATGDPTVLAHALGIVARAKGMTQISKETGLSREQLYRSFSKEGNPSLKSTFAVMKALGIEWTSKVV